LVIEILVGDDDAVRDIEVILVSGFFTFPSNARVFLKWSSEDSRFLRRPQRMYVWMLDVSTNDLYSSLYFSARPFVLPGEAFKTQRFNHYFPSGKHAILHSMS
jgi:hypothetical protein